MLGSPTLVTSAGEQLMLTCTANIEEYIQAIPTLTWRLPGNTDDTSTGLQSTAGTTSTITLSFEPLHTSHGGVYVCETSVNISGIAPQFQTANITVRVQSKWSMVMIESSKRYFVSTVPPLTISIHDHPIPYNGTVFTLTGVVELDPSVDTGVTVSGVWSNGGGPQETTSPPYTTNLTFQPLATDNSGEYTLTVTARPSDGSLFIVTNDGNFSYSLTVTRKPYIIEINFYNGQF